MVLVHLQPVVIVIVCHAIATDGGVGGVLDHALCLAWTHVSVSVLLGLVGGWWSGSHCVGSIRWCVWSVRPSGPLRLPHLKCLLLLLLLLRQLNRHYMRQLNRHYMRQLKRHYMRQLNRHYMRQLNRHYMRQLNRHYIRQLNRHYMRQLNRHNTLTHNT